MYTFDDYLKRKDEYGFTADQISDADDRLAQMNPDAGMALLGYKNDWLTATNDSAKAMAHAGAEDIRSRYGSYTGGGNGGSFVPTGTAQYEDPWETAVNAQIRNLENRNFEWSPQTDPTLKYYEDAYRREGERAMKDTLGAVAATTGGIPSSYATAAAAQQRNYYAQQLTDMYPQLYQQAFDRFMQEYDRDYQMLGVYNAQSEQDYGRWFDQQERDRQARQDLAAAEQQAFENQYLMNEHELNLRKFDHEVQMAIKDDAYRWASLLQEGKIAEAEEEYRRSALALEEKQTAWDYAVSMAEIGYKQDVLTEERRQFDLDREQQETIALIEEQLRRDQMAEDHANAEWDRALAAAQMGDVSKLAALGVDTTTYQKLIDEELGITDDEVVIKENKGGAFGSSYGKPSKKADGTWDMNVLLAKYDEGRPLTDEEMSVLEIYWDTIGRTK